MAKCPYQNIGWTLADDFDVSTIVSRTKELSGRIPSSSSGEQIGSGVLVLTSADFTIGKIEGTSIRATLSRGRPNSGATVNLIYDGKANTGFFNAHKVFSVDIILSILYGELTPSRTQELIHNSL